MKKWFFFSALFLVLAVSGYAQSAEKISEIIQTNNVTYGQLAYLTAVYQDRVAEDASYAQAVAVLQKSGIVSPVASADDTLTLAEAAFLCADATGIKGGLFYSLFHNARYAYKELKAKGILPQTADSSMKVSGRDAIAILNGCLSLAEAQ